MPTKINTETEKSTNASGVSLTRCLGRTFILQLSVVGLVVGTIIMALNRIEGWGWLLFMAFLIELVIHDIE